MPYFQVAYRTEQLLQNKFFDMNTPSMRKGSNGGEKKRGKKEKTDENSGHYRPKDTARTTTTGTPHACANIRFCALPCKGQH